MIDRCLRYIGDCLFDVPTSISVGMLFVLCIGTVLLLAFWGLKKGLRYSSGLMLVEYLLLLLSETVLCRLNKATRTFDLLPFWSYRAVRDGGHELLLTQMIMNVFAFIPIGLLLGCFFGRMKWWKVMAIGGGFSFLIEVLQFVFKRGFAEFDDVFHNVLGCLIGFGVYVLAIWLIRKISPYVTAQSK